MAKSFYTKFEDMTEKDFIDSYFPIYGVLIYKVNNPLLFQQDHNEFLDKVYFSEEELKYYNIINEVKPIKKTVKQKIRFFLDFFAINY